MRFPKYRLAPYAEAFCVVAALACAQPALGQPRGDPLLSLAQAERSAADLHRGMSADEVRKLLGKPKRTGLKDDGASAASRGGTAMDVCLVGNFRPQHPARGLRVRRAGRLARARLGVVDVLRRRVRG